MEFRVTYADGEVAEGIKAIPSARRAIEAQYQKPFPEVVQSGFSDWADLAVWTFLRARCGEERSLEEWLDTVDKIELAVEVDENPPTSGTGQKRAASSKRRSTKAKTSTG